MPHKRTDPTIATTQQKQDSIIMSNHFNAQPLKTAGSFDGYDSVDEFSVQMAQTDDESMAMSELGSVLGGVSIIGQRNNSMHINSGTSSGTTRGGTDGQVAALQQVKSSEEEIYEDDNNTSYDVSDCASFVNSELGISAGDVSAILFGGRSANYSGSPSKDGNYVNGMFGKGMSSGYDSNINTSHDDTIGDLFAKDDDSVADSIIDPALDSHLQVTGSKKKLGPLGDELSYAQDDSTAPPPLCSEQSATAPAATDLHIDINMTMQDEELNEYEEGIHRGILPEWLSTSNSRMKSLLVVSSALIVGSLVMGVMALGANSNWWEFNETGGSDLPSFSSEVTEDLSLPVLMPTLEPSVAPVSTLAPASDETGESLPVVTTAEIISTMPTSFPSLQPTSTHPTMAPTKSPVLSPVTSVPTLKPVTNAPSISISPSTLAPIDPTMTPTEKPIDSPTTTPTEKPSDIPTMQPVTDIPTVNPSKAPVTKSPTESPTMNPSGTPTQHPSNTPSMSPTESPSTGPSASPTTETPSASPTLIPSNSPTSSPTPIPTRKPTDKPTVSMAPTMSMGSDATVSGDVTFYLMADGGTNVPYWTSKLETLDVDKNEAKFLVHLGSAVRQVDNCKQSAYISTTQSLKTTPVPVYAVPGNNDWPRCANPTQGLNFWKKHLIALDNSWKQPTEYSVKRQNPFRSENFSFLYKRILFVGLHIVHNEDEEETALRTEENLKWLDENVEHYSKDIDVIFMMGNGRLMAKHNFAFYNNIVTKKQNEWKNKYVIYARRASETGVLTNIGGLEKFDELRVGSEWPILDVHISTTVEGKDSGLSALLQYRQVRDVDDGKDKDKKAKNEPK